MGFKTWTSEEEQLLRNLRREDPKMQFKEIGQIMGRTTSMVCNKWQLLEGIPNKKRTTALEEVNARQRKFDMLRAGQTILARKLLNPSIQGKYEPSVKMKIITNNGSQIICKTARGIEGITRGAIISKEYLISVEKAKVAV